MSGESAIVEYPGDFTADTTFDLREGLFRKDVFRPTEMEAARSLYAGREYHTFAHAQSVALACMSHPYWPDPETDLCRVIMRGALWHDAVYRPGYECNERESALLACVWAGESECGDLTDAILATRHTELAFEKAADDGYHAQCLADSDLIWLSLPWASYEKNTRLIDKEFSSFFGEKELYLGRVKWIRGMLGRDRLFHSDLWESSYGGAARRNMWTELSVLCERVRIFGWEVE